MKIGLRQVYTVKIDEASGQNKDRYTMRIRLLPLLLAVAAMACSLTVGEQTAVPPATSPGSASASQEAEPLAATPTLETLTQDVYVTGTVAAQLAGELQEWHTVLSPGIGGALFNSATWSDELDADGYYGADLTAAIYGADFREPTSTLDLRFPFQPGASGQEFDVVPEGEQQGQASIGIEWDGNRYRVSQGRLELEAVRIEGDYASLQGTFEGMLEPRGSGDGSQETGWQQTLYLESGRFNIVRAIAKSAIPGPRPPEQQ